MNDDSIAKHMYCHVLSVLLTGQKKKKKKKKKKKDVKTHHFSSSLTLIYSPVLFVRQKCQILRRFSGNKKNVAYSGLETNLCVWDEKMRQITVWYWSFCLCERGSSLHVLLGHFWHLWNPHDVPTVPQQASCLDRPGRAFPHYNIKHNQIQ